LLTEPLPTAFALTIAAVLLALSVLASRTSGRLGVPFLLLFLLLGMAAGSEGLGRIPFEDYRLAFRVGTVALVLILFDGGLNTSVASLRHVFAPATVLATIGVAGTAAFTAAGARVLGFPWPEALLLGAIASSTDAAAVFSILRGAGTRLRQRVARLLEVESGVNDPMAVILTLGVTRALVSGTAHRGALLLDVVLQFAVGIAAGVAIGYAGRWLLRVRLDTAGLYPVLTTAVALFAFGAPTLLWGSGFVAVYVAAVVLGNGHLPWMPGLRRVHDAMAWFSQVAMFLLLGLLAFPSRVAAVAAPGLFLGAFLALVARPVVVALCLAPFRLPAREVLFVAWVGLRGAVPIMLATFPVVAGLEGAHRVFDLVFFVVLVSAVLQGTSIRWLARRLGLEAAGPPDPRAVLEILSMQPLAGEVMSFHIEPASAVAGSRISELPIPDRSAVILVVRGREVVAARGRTVLQPGDHVYVFTPPEEKPFVQLLFGRQEQE
jgi:cell volume regulation protein A